MLPYAALSLLVLPVLFVLGNSLVARRRAAPRRAFFGDAIEARHRDSR